MDSSGINSLFHFNRAGDASGNGEKGTGPEKGETGDFVSEFLALLFADSSSELSTQQEAVAPGDSRIAEENSEAELGSTEESEIFEFRNPAQGLPTPGTAETGRQVAGTSVHSTNQEEISAADGEPPSAGQEVGLAEPSRVVSQAAGSKTAPERPVIGPIGDDEQVPTDQEAGFPLESLEPEESPGPGNSDRIEITQDRTRDLKRQTAFKSEFEDESPGLEEASDETRVEEDGVRLVRETGNQSRGDSHSSAEHGRGRDRTIEFVSTPRNSKSNDTVAELLDTLAVESDFESELTRLESKERLTLKTLDPIFDGMIDGGRFRKIGESFRLDIRLEPESLGKVRIETILDKENVMRAVIEAEDPAVRNLIEQKLPLLIERLQEDGIDLSEVSVQLMDADTEGSSPRDENRPTTTDQATRSPNRTGDDADGRDQNGRSSYLDDGRIHYFA